MSANDMYYTVSMLINFLAPVGCSNNFKHMFRIKFVSTCWNCS